jgi:hypothetical protein
MLSNRHKALLHIYKSAAGLGDSMYRDILAKHGGCVSAADPEFKISSFAGCMAALETHLWERVDAGLVDPPGGKVFRRDYWRSQVRAPGLINATQQHLIETLWSQFSAFLPAEKRTPAYFAGLVSQAANVKTPGMHVLTAAQAGLVIDCLRARLAIAMRAAA